MTIQKIVLGSFQTNTYILLHKKEAIIIDPSIGFEKIKEAIKDYHLKACLLTHGHYDHIASLNDLIIDYPQVPIYIHENEEHFLTDPVYNLSFILTHTEFIFKGKAKLLKKDDILHFLDCNILCKWTPGHSYGSLSYYFEKENVIFTGDTLFKNSIGRTDFPTSNYDQLVESVKNEIFTLPDHTQIFPGHLENTDVLYEKENNVFFK